MKKYFKTYQLLLATSLLFFAIAFISQLSVYDNTSNHTKVVSRAQSVINKNEKQIDIFLDSVTSQVASFYTSKGHSFNELTRTIQLPVSNLKLFIYNKNELKYWSGNDVVLEADEMQMVKSRHVAFVKNGWYEFFTRSAGDFKITALWLIKTEYFRPNFYLKNKFNPDLQLPDDAEMMVSQSTAKLSSHSVLNNHQEFLFAINFNPESIIYYPYYINLLYMAAISLLYIFFYFAAKRTIYSKNLLMLFLLVVAAVGIRAAFYFLKIPHVVYNSTLFDNQLFASGLGLRSLGEFILNSIVVAFISSLFPHFIQRYRITGAIRKSGFLKFIVVFFLLCFSIAVMYCVNLSINLLIENSKISFAFNKYNELNIYSWYGLVIIFLLLYSFFCIIAAFSSIISGSGIREIVLIILSLLAAAAAFFLEFRWPFKPLADEYQLREFFYGLILIFFFYEIVNYHRKLNFARISLLIVGLSFYTAINIQSQNTAKEERDRISLVQRLEYEHDIIAEYLFSDILKRVSSDKILPTYFSGQYERTATGAPNQSVIQKRISQQYLDSYWSKYQIHIKAFDADGKLLSTPSDTINTFDKYLEYIDENGEPTPIDDFYYVDLNGRLGCRGVLKVFDNSNPGMRVGSIVLEFNPKYNQLVGLPVLLINDRISEDIVNEDYAYAKYEDNILKNKSGNMQFYYSLKEYIKIRPERANDVFKSANGWSMLFHDYAGNFTIVIAKKEDNLFTTISAIFIYLFTFLFLSYTIGFIVMRLVRNNWRLQIDYSRRIQLYVITVVLLSMVIIGASTIAFISNQFLERQQQKFIETLSSVSLIAENELTDRDTLLNDMSSDMVLELVKIAATFKTDYNIFDAGGVLRYTSQPAIFEQSLISNRMNRKAFIDLRDELRSNFTQTETIGNLNYTSAYQPLYDKSNRLIAYLNIPFFSNEDELDREVSSVLITLTNWYVPLIAFSILIAIIITRRLSQPLQMIRNHMAKMSLGKRNEHIEWKHANDEIGALVKQYNSMVDELMISADRLARSERESAWREMAKQVAHEIKNPLTPMKLSVQHLQRAMNDKSPNMDAIVQRISNTLIQQIDTLSSIATEFSNFAKMPIAKFEPVELNQVIKNTVQLFSNESAAIVHYDIPDYPLLVNADKEQMVRVISNLLKNAIQAIPTGKQGLIEVIARDDYQLITLLVSDNGTGISLADRSRIFVPNFTTKSTGTGLGLSIVKNIVESTNGKTWFESEPGKGTTFYVELPKYTESQN